MNDANSVPVVLTIAGSDSGGGAGIQADLRTFSALGVFGTSAITCITAQNPDEVAGVEPIDPDMVARQIRTVVKGFPVSAVKTGMLFSAPIIGSVARTVAELGIAPLVVDPVMVATSGARLLQEDAVESLCTDLLPGAAVITPNLPEAEILWGRGIGSVDDMKVAARQIGEKHGAACVVKGGHLRRDEGGNLRAELGRDAELGSAFSAIRRDKLRNEEESEIRNPKSEIVKDVLFVDGEVLVFGVPRVDAVETHGTGCTFSAAITAFLALGDSTSEAVRKAGLFVADALRNTVKAGKHFSLGIRMGGA